MAGQAIYNAAADLLAERPGISGKKTAFQDPARRLSYDDLRRQVRQAAAMFKGLGLRREDRVVLLMLDTIDMPVVFLGAIWAGLVPIPLNTLLSRDLYGYILQDSRARAVVVSSALLPAIEPCLAAAPEVGHVIVTDGAADPQHIDFTKAIASQPDDGPAAETHPDEPAFWLYSSGSTGMPKGVKHVQSSIMATATLYGQGVLGIRSDDVCYSAAKLFFAYGLGNSLSFPLSVGATTILYPDRPTPGAVFGLLKEHRPTLFFGVPTLYAAMLGDQSLAAETGSAGLRLCVSAGEALPEHIGKGWRARFGVDILDGVGSTELLHIFLSNGPNDVVYGTSGVAVPGYDLKLVDEAGREPAQGEIGELLVHGPSSAEGYWNQRDKSRSTFEGGWTRTGDKYVRDENGRYVYCGRTDDMFKVGGIWVAPFEVEAALGSHHDVLEAAVVAAEDGDGLLKPKAFVVLKQGADQVGLHDRLKDHVKDRIGAWKYPRWIEVVETLPKTATGKIQRFRLRTEG